MSEEKKSSWADKAVKAAVVGGVVVGGAAALPQDELAKEGLPAFWEAIKGVAASGWESAKIKLKEFRPYAFRCWTKLVSTVKWWVLLSAALIVAGIEVKTRLDSNVGHVLVAGGTMSFCALGILLYALTDGIAAILYLKLKVGGAAIEKAASIVGIHVPEVLTEAKLAKFREKIRLILAGTVVMCFSLLFTLLFPAYSTLGWTMCFWAMVAVAVACMLYLNFVPGKAIKVVFYATISLIAATFVVFILDRLTGGALKFGAFRNWLLKVNGSEILMAILFLVPVTLLLVSAFAKDADAKAAFRISAKYVGVASALLLAFLLYKGTISWKDASGHEAPKMVKETVEKVETASFSDLKSSDKKTSGEAAPSPRNPGPSQGIYLAPPSGDVGPTDVPAPRTSKPRAKKQPLPPLKAKKYEDAATAVSDLESLL